MNRIQNCGKTSCVSMDLIMYAYENDNQTIAYFGANQRHCVHLHKMAMELIKIHIIPIKKVYFDKIVFLNGSQILFLSQHKNTYNRRFDVVKCDHYCYESSERNSK